MTMNLLHQESPIMHRMAHGHPPAYPATAASPTTASTFSAFVAKSGPIHPPPGLNTAPSASSAASTFKDCMATTAPWSPATAVDMAQADPLACGMSNMSIGQRRLPSVDTSSRSERMHSISTTASASTAVHSDLLMEQPPVWIHDAKRVASWLHTLPRHEATAALRLILASLGKETLIEALNDVAPVAAAYASPTNAYYTESPRAPTASPGSTPAGIIGHRFERKLDTLHEEPALVSPTSITHFDWRSHTVSPLAESRSTTPNYPTRPNSIALDSMSSLWSSPPMVRSLSTSTAASPSVLLGPTHGADFGAQMAHYPDLELQPPPRPRTCHEEGERYTPTHRRSRSFHGSSTWMPSSPVQQHHHAVPFRHMNKSEKGKIPEQVDFKLLEDIPGWLRSLRLHKYTSVFTGEYRGKPWHWRDMVYLEDAELEAIGVSALGARRKLVKVFRMIRRSLGEDIPEDEEAAHSSA